MPSRQSSPQPNLLLKKNWKTLGLRGFAGGGRSPISFNIQVASKSAAARSDVQSDDCAFFVCRYPASKTLL